MAIVNRSFSVNVTPGMMPPIVHVSEYDVGRAYTVSILDEQGNIFTIPSGTTASIEGTLNGSVGFTKSATVSNNQVSFTLSQDMTAYSGKAWCKIKLTQNSQPIQTCAFVLAVDRAGVEADTILHSPGFQEQINEGIAEYFDNDPPFFELPSGGQSGQALLSDGNDGAEWGQAGVEVDTTLTRAGEAADAKAVGDIFKEIDAYSVSVLQFESGTIGNDGNTNVANTARARTDFVAVKSGDVMNQLASGYEWFMYRFDSAKNLLDKSSAFESGNYTFSANGYFRLAVKRQDGGTINQTEINSLSESGFNCGASYRKIPVIDSTLTQEGQAADAAAVGEALANLPSGGSGLTNAVKQALLACFQNVAWANANGLTYYNALISAFTEDEGGGGGGSALYPMETGSKTFSNGMVVSVSNGNHVDITGLKQGEQIWNLSDLAINNSNAAISNNGSSVNNLQTSLFTIPSGSRADLEIKNVSATRNDIFGVQDTGKQLVLNFRKTETSASAFESLLYPASPSERMTYSYTFSEAVDISCALMYASDTRGDHPVDISFDIFLYVDGARWI